MRLLIFKQKMTWLGMLLLLSVAMKQSNFAFFHDRSSNTSKLFARGYAECCQLGRLA